MLLICKFIVDNEPVRATVIHGVRYIVILMVAAALYVFLVKFFQTINNVEPYESYSYFNIMKNTSLFKFFQNIVDAYKQLFSFFVMDSIYDEEGNPLEVARHPKEIIKFEG